MCSMRRGIGGTRAVCASNIITASWRVRYAMALYGDDCATLDDLCEAVATLDDTERIARRVLGGSNPLAIDIEKALRHARALLHARETPQPAEDRAEEVD